MKLPSITLARVGGKWVPLYIGDDADAAKKAAARITEGKEKCDGGLLFVRPEYTKRLRIPSESRVPEAGAEYGKAKDEKPEAKDAEPPKAGKAGVK